MDKRQLHNVVGRPNDMKHISQLKSKNQSDKAKKKTALAGRFSA
jgi:hypothetical protein